MRVGSVCTGYGGYELALTLAGIDHDLAWVSEIDPAACKVLDARFPDVPNVGDINDSTPPTVDVLTAGFPCFAAGTIITTQRGLIPIEKVVVGDLALTHLGRWRKVTSLMKRDGAPTRTVSATGVPGTVTTDEHPYYASVQGRIWNNDRRQYDRTYSTPEWVDAKDLTTKHRLAQILPPLDTSISGDKAFWHLVGLYLADGWRVRRKKTGTGHPAKNLGRVVICANYDERDEVETAIKQAGFSATTVEERTVVKFHIVDSSFYRFLEQFGHKAHGKTIPGWVLGLDSLRAGAMLDGYLFGDGSDHRSGARASTVSRALAIGVAGLALRARQVVAGVTFFERPPTCVIEGRTVNQRSTYTIDIPHSPRRTFVDDGHVGWRLVTKNEPTGRTETVYNISIEEDESYVADGATVHNCQDISAAGHKKGLNGDKSKLWWRIRDVISDIRPGYVLLENVSRIAADGGPAVIGALTEIGYDSRWVTLEAADVGAPHHRERWFCVATDTDRSGRARWAQDTWWEQIGRAAVSGPGGTIGHPESGRRHVPPAEGPGQHWGPERSTRRSDSATTDPGLSDRAGTYGKWGPAIRRWEAIMGRSAPSPVTSVPPNTKSDQAVRFGREHPDGSARLNPAFVEWMMGLPAGWVTDVDISRTAQLRCLGNGIVPLQAAAALQALRGEPHDSDG